MPPNDTLKSAVAVFPELDNLSSAMIDTWLYELPPDEQIRAKTFKSSRRLFQFVVGRHLLARLIGAQLNFVPVIVTAENGAPSVVGRNIHVSVSHSSKAIAAGFCEVAPLGVDIECARDRDVIRLASEYFHADEVATLHALTGQAQIDKFYYYWTRKEAVSKVTGRGLSRQLLGTLTMYPDFNLTIRTGNIRGHMLSIAHTSSIVPKFFCYEVCQSSCLTSLIELPRLSDNSNDCDVLTASIHTRADYPTGNQT